MKKKKNRRKKSKNIEKICGNCRLFDPSKRQCQVVILAEGQRVKLPVDAKDPCFFEEPYFNPISGEQEDFNEIKEVKFWVENNYGEKTDGQGKVKIEYPEGFFGDNLDNILGMPPINNLDDLLDLF